MFRWSGKFLEGLESCRRIWKVSRWSGKLLNWYIGHHLDRIFDWICWIWSSVEWSGKFPDGLESSGMVWKVSEWSGKFSSGLEGFSMCKWLPKMFSSLFSEAQFVNYGLGRVHLSDFAILVARQAGRHAILSNNAKSSHLLIWLLNGFFVPTTSSYIRNETIYHENYEWPLFAKTLIPKYTFNDSLNEKCKVQNHFKKHLGY